MTRQLIIDRQVGETFSPNVRFIDTDLSGFRSNLTNCAKLCLQVEESTLFVHMCMRTHYVMTDEILLISVAYLNNNLFRQPREIVCS